MKLRRYWIAFRRTAVGRGVLIRFVYDELRKLAARHMANKAPGDTLDATALVHEHICGWFAPPEIGPSPIASTSSQPPPRPCAASSSIRPAARRLLKRSAVQNTSRSTQIDSRLRAIDADSWLDLDEVLAVSEKVDAPAAELAKLRIFGGLSGASERGFRYAASNSVFACGAMPGAWFRCPRRPSRKYFGLIRRDTP